MACDTRRQLESDIDGAAHHLKMRLKEKEIGDLKFDLGDVKRMAQDLIDALDQLREHEDQHGCNA